VKPVISLTAFGVLGFSYEGGEFNLLLDFTADLLVRS
jgi:hypothetical protein